jgi:hypothetical protein
MIQYHHGKFGEATSIRHGSHMAGIVTILNWSLIKISTVHFSAQHGPSPITLAFSQVFIFSLIQFLFGPKPFYNCLRFWALAFYDPILLRLFSANLFFILQPFFLIFLSWTFSGLGPGLFMFGTVKINYKSSPNIK